MVSTLRFVTYIVLVTFVVGAFSAPSKAQSISKQLAGESVLVDIQKRGKLRAGVSSFIPWVMRAKDGSLIGFEIDIATQVAKDMGVEVEFVPTAFSGVIAALVAGEFDFIMNGISLVPKRNLTVNFSNPYTWHGMGFAANKKLTGNWKLEQFNSSDVIFTVRRGSNDSIAAVRQIAKKAKIRQFDDDAQAIQDVLNGTAHGFITSEPKPSTYAYDYPDQIWQPMGKQMMMRWASAFAVRKGDPDAINWLNNWISLRTERGFIEERRDYWFRTRDWKDRVASK